MSERIKRRRIKESDGSFKRTQLEIAEQICKVKTDQDGFVVRHIDEFIGSGVFTTKPFVEGAFLLEYEGNLIKNYRYACRLEKEYEEAKQGSFMYFFKHNEKNMCVDATNFIFGSGRMVNDAEKSDSRNNCSMMIIKVDNRPHLCLFANRNIAAHEELRYDYGLPNLPWRKGNGKTFPEHKEGTALQSDTSSSETAISEISSDEHYDSDRDPDFRPVENSGSSSDESDIIFSTPNIARFRKTTPKKLVNEIIQRMQSDPRNMSIKKSLPLHACPSPSMTQVVTSSPPDVHDNDVDGINIPTTNNTYHRHYDKRYYCIFCEKPQSKLSKHLKSKHYDKDDVSKWMSEVDKDVKLKLYEKMRNIGNHLHNVKVLESGCGQLSVTYRPRDQQKIDPRDYGPCPYCYAYFPKRELWRHNKNCKFSCENKPRKALASSSSMLLPRSKQSSAILTQVLEAMKSDKIGRIAKSDDTIIAFGEKLCTKRGHDKEQHNYIRQKLRELGRLLQTMRKNDGNSSKSLEDYMYPDLYKFIIGCCKEVAGFDSSANTFATPSLALKVGGSLQKCLKILTTKGIENGRMDLQTRAEELSRLFEFNWTDDISSNALRTLHESNRNSNKGVLPLANDVKRMTEYLRDAAAICARQLQADTEDEPSVMQSWTRLSEICLCQTIVFNRRRPGEVSKMTIDDYRNKKKTNTDGELDMCLSVVEKELCKHFYRTEIIAKRGRIAAVLFPKQVKEDLDLLISKRDSIIKSDNNYLFPTRSTINHIRGTDALRIYSQECGAEFPERLRATKLRKHIATMTQLFNMTENEIDILANFLGHDIRVHREFYRLPQETVQVAKVSKLLLMMESGRITQTSAKSLDNITLGDDIIEEEEMEQSEEESDNDTGVPIDRGVPEMEADIIYRRVPETKATTTGARKKARCIKRSWSEEERNAVRRHLDKFIMMGKLPGKSDIKKCQDSEPVLNTRNWKNVKDFCRNAIDTLRRQGKL